MGLALIGFALFKGREKIKVSALTYPYSLVSAVNTSDEIDIKLLIFLSFVLFVKASFSYLL